MTLDWLHLLLWIGGSLVYLMQESLIERHKGNHQIVNIIMSLMWPILLAIVGVSLAWKQMKKVLR